MRRMSLSIQCVCSIATISVDHLGVIGDTLEEIAQTKAGIIKPDVQ